MDLRDFSPATVLKIAAVVFGLAITLRFFWVAHPVFIIVFLGLLLGLPLARAADYLEGKRIPRGISAPLILLAVLGTVVGAGWAMAPLVRDQTKDLAQELPKAIDRVEAFLDRAPVPLLEGAPPEQSAAPDGQTAAPSTDTSPGAQRESAEPAGTRGERARQPAAEPDPADEAASRGAAPAGGGLKQQLGKELRGATRFLFPVLSTTFGAIAGLLLVLFIAIYVAVAPRVYKKGFLHLVPHRARPRADEVLSKVGQTLRQWLIARLIAMVLVGLITGAGLAVLQVRGAAALGLLAGLLEFVPFFGPIVSAIPGIGVALVDSPEKALWVAGFYVVVQQLESNLITPLLLKSRLDIPPAMTLVAVSALGMVFGVIGMLVAEPLLAAILVTTKVLYVRDVVGDDVKVGKEE